VLRAAVVGSADAKVVVFSIRELIVRKWVPHMVLNCVFQNFCTLPGNGYTIRLAITHSKAASNLGPRDSAVNLAKYVFLQCANIKATELDALLCDPPCACSGLFIFDWTLRRIVLQSPAAQNVANVLRAVSFQPRPPASAPKMESPS
jgi:hypothetical protein